MIKPILAIDMDCVIADFEKATTDISPAAMYKTGFFLNLEVVPGAQEAVRQLYRSGLYDIHILSKPVFDSPISYTEKSMWVAKHFPYLLNKITLTQNKELFLGTYLIDDDIHWAPRFPGKFLHFDKNNSLQCWVSMVELLLLDDAEPSDKLDKEERTPIFI